MKASSLSSGGANASTGTSWRSTCEGEGCLLTDVNDPHPPEGVCGLTPKVSEANICHADVSGGLPDPPVTPPPPAHQTYTLIKHIPAVILFV